MHYIKNYKVSSLRFFDLYILNFPILNSEYRFPQPVKNHINKNINENH